MYFHDKGMQRFVKITVQEPRIVAPLRGNA
jgi:hypothetical protein